MRIFLKSGELSGESTSPISSKSVKKHGRYAHARIALVLTNFAGLYLCHFFIDFEATNGIRYAHICALTPKKTFFEIFQNGGRNFQKTEKKIQDLRGGRSL